MSIQQLRMALRNRIDQIDERFLRVMYAMAETYIKEQEDAELEAQINAVPPHPDWKPMTEEELLARLQEATAQIERGEYITLEELKKKSEQW